MRGLANRAEAGKGAGYFEDSGQKDPWQRAGDHCQRELGCMCLGGKLGLPLKARDGPSSAAGAEKGGWAAGLLRGRVGRCSRPPTLSPGLLVETGSGGPECHPGASEAFSIHCSLPFPGCSPESASVARRFMSLPGRSALAELNALCHVCAESTCF